MNKNIFKTIRKLIVPVTVCFAVLMPAISVYPADIIILGDTAFKPVSDVVEGINETLLYNTTVLSPSVTGKGLNNVVVKENAKAVIALGMDAVSISLSLPESVPVVYGLITSPIETGRKNITGVYMTTPVSEYISFLNRYFPGIKKVGVVCMRDIKELIDLSPKSPEIKYCSATNPYEFIAGLNSLANDVDALLLLPEKDLLTEASLKELYLFSFKRKIPVIGISEKYVKIGSLFSLGFDTTAMGRQIGEMTNKVVLHGDAKGIPQNPPGSFSLHVNSKTSEIMGINVPPNLLKTARKVYP
ncbi:MAG: hypothetical protein OEU95_05485 [Nitrospirota bacterium]|nr:hypothetical protein [Nitrospirota bacterium]